MSDWSDSGQEEGGKKVFDHLPFAAFDQSVDYYIYSRTFGMGLDSMVPMEYQGWREEEVSWKETCYIHAGLNPAPTFRVRGPEALKFFSDHCVNSFAKFEVGALKHGIMCNEEGNVIAHGVLMRLAEDDFISYFMAPYAAYRFYSGGYDAQGEWVQDRFMLQVAGPRSLEVLETATGECLHDIKFGRHRLSSIGDIEVRVSRMGMAGTLGYEVHGPTERAVDLYNVILAAGEPFGIVKIGWRAWQLHHTANGFPQSFVHFPLPWGEDKGFMAFMKFPPEMDRFPTTLAGSMGPDIELRYRNPVELGWGGAVKFDHDFVGRAALEIEVTNPRRKMVTLEWNPEDVVDVYASQFDQGEAYMWMDPLHLGQHQAQNVLYADQVMKDGKVVGISSGRQYSYYFRKMLSLCSIDIAQAELGNEVTVLWGAPGLRQKEIRATVVRYPYLNENRNEDIDVDMITCRASGNLRRP